MSAKTLKSLTVKIIVGQRALNGGKPGSMDEGKEEGRDDQKNSIDRILYASKWRLERGNQA